MTYFCKQQTAIHARIYLSAEVADDTAETALELRR